MPTTRTDITDIDAWLGEFADTTADTTKAALADAFDTIHAAYHPDDDFAYETQEATNGAGMLLLGDATLDELATTWQQAERGEREARYRLHGGIIAAIGQGMSENEAARISGISRTTVRKLLGK